MNLKEMQRLPPDQQAALFKKIGAARKKGKATNYSATYGAGGATIARSAGVSQQEGDVLHKAYWKLNWSIPAVADGITTKTCNGQRWLYNPVSGFWYSLRHTKDIWSTLNQGTGVYCFDTWVKYVRSKGLPIIAQMHDEIIGLIKKGLRDRASSVCKWAVKEANKELKLNRDLDCSIDFGDSYAEIH